MKKYLLALSTFAILSTGASAQKDSTSAFPQHRMHMGQMMKGGMHKFHHSPMANLNLTDAQKQQAKAIREDYHNKVAALEKDDNITLKDYRAQKAALEKERKAKFEALLTPDQKDKIEEGKKKMHERMKVIADRRMQHMKADLNLSDDQVAKIKQQRESRMQQARAIKDDVTLSQEEKREQFMALRKTFKDNMNSILTPEQIKKREELRNDRMSEWKNRRDNKAS